MESANVEIRVTGPQLSRVYTESARWHERAVRSIVGGVNSPSRSFQAVGGDPPVVMARGQGARFVDVDGNEYVDYLGGYGPSILGHAHPRIAQAIWTAANEGVLYGTPTRWEVEFAEQLRLAMPELERLRFVNSGTEAVMSTIRVARGVTKRQQIVKFAGCYHGHSDAMLVAAGSGPSSIGVPDSAGVPATVAGDILTVPFNDIAALSALLRRQGTDVAAILVEPIVGNFGIVAPTDDHYLAEVIRLAHDVGALVIFDEVITGFRFHYGSAAGLYNVRPDLTALGKIIGGGLPIGAYGGRQDIMDSVAPLGPVYQAGTMAGNPASMRAGLALLEVLRDKEIYERMATFAATLETALYAAAAAAELTVTVNRVNGALTVFFGVNQVRNYEDAKASDGAQFARMFRELLRRGICLAPSKFEAWFVSAAHTEADVEWTLAAIADGFHAMRDIPERSDNRQAAPTSTAPSQ